MRTGVSFALLVLIAIPACGSDSDLEIAQEQREIWNDAAVTDYTVEVVSQIAGVHYHARVVVSGDESSSFALPDQQELATDQVMPDLSIDGLFDQVIGALEQGDVVIVEYDAELGHPVRAEIHRQGRVDTFRVEVFSDKLLGPPDMEVLPLPPAETTGGSFDVGDAPSFELSR